MYEHGTFWPMIILTILWIGLMILGFFLITNYINGGTKKTPQKILKERLAKGEIDETEYKRLKETIAKKY